MKKYFALCIFLFTISSLFARDVIIYVKDRDLDLPLEGSVIRSWDGNSYTCDEEGKTVIQVPDSRQVAIQAVYPGYETTRIIIPLAGDIFTIGMRLSGVIQSQELVIEAARPGSSESRTGRSVAVSGREITQTAEIGIIEDVMNTIKLLPGVNYTGIFNAQPSIRGGHPGDMSASLNGFYINNPYHWGGSFSIFDPRMVQSIQLSHGVFSARYGHTISGLLELTSNKPSPTETQFELGINTSTANFNLSLPLFNKGGIMFIGRVTYYDPVIALAQQLSNVFEELEIINFIRKAPYIRSASLNGNYRFTDNLEINAIGFWGIDGVSVYYLNSDKTDTLHSDTSADFAFTNFQGYFTTSLLWNPRTDMLLKILLGAGYEDVIIDGKMSYNIYERQFSPVFKTNFPEIFAIVDDTYDYYEDSLINQSDYTFSAQGRLDFDWELSEHILLAAGFQEMFNRYISSGDQQVLNEVWFHRFKETERDFIKSLFSMIPDDSGIWNNLRIGTPVLYSPDPQNKLFTTSAFILGEFSSKTNKIQAEIGLRIDHFYLQGKDFSASSNPALNPRLNLDFNLLKNAGFLQSLDISAGTGLFSSINSSVFAAEERYDTTFIKPNRSSTSVLGLKFQFPESLSLNIEGYYKYIFDRMYIVIPMSISDEIEPNPFFDGEGKVWGIDLMLHKMQSRFWDGWLSYSWNWAKYRDPNGRFGVMGISGGNRGNDWYFTPYHRFHNLNLVLNVKPKNDVNIYFRFGFASGLQQLQRVGDFPQNYPVLVYDKENPKDSYFIEKFYWPAAFDENNRSKPSFPMDIKISFYGSNKNGKTRYELYVALENILALLYNSNSNTSVNPYTGQVDIGSDSATYDIPIPIPSFGFKISY